MGIRCYEKLNEVWKRRERVERGRRKIGGMGR
jgi:hypothetical protein